MTQADWTRQKRKSRSGTDEYKTTEIQSQGVIVTTVGDALIDVWFSLLGLSYSLAHTYKFLKKLFFHALWTLL